MKRIEQLIETVTERRVCDFIRAAPPSKPMPFEFAKLLPGEGKKCWDVWQDQACISDSSSPGDFATISEWKKAIEYFAHQFGGLVSWEEDHEDND